MDSKQKILQQQKQNLKHCHSAHEEFIGQLTLDAICTNCGAHIQHGVKYCEECGYLIGSVQCPHCHNQVNSELELCPNCGSNIHLERCSFCGGAMDENEKFCSECGNAREGIICPECGTLNFRSFCRKCNTPLNEMAMNMLDEVRTDSRVVQSSKLAVELDELEQKIIGIIQQMESVDDVLGNTLDTSSNLTVEDQSIINSYNELFGIITTSSNVVKFHDEVVSQHKVRKKVNIDNDLLKSAIEEYHAKVSEMQSVLDTMLPDPNDPPEIQRNFLCACKFATYSMVKSKKKEPVGWICNLCGCYHSQPSECARPELGGKWVYQEIEIINKIINSSTVYL